MRPLLLFLALWLAGCPDGEEGGIDAMPDAGRLDARIEDAESIDAEPVDAEPVDAEPVDADAIDAGAMDADPADGGIDAGELDAEAIDGGTPDGGTFFRLSVSTSTGGSVLTSPGSIACTDSPSAPCEELFPEGTQVTLTASAAAEFTFDRWSGDCSGGPIATVTMDADRSCAASFVGTEGEIALVPPPISVVPNQTEDPADILIFRERTGLTSPPGVPLDLHVPDTYGAEPAIGELPAGLSVDVYFIHFDPVGTPGTPVRRTARLFFPGRIVGIISMNTSLDLSDSTLGLTSTVTYPAAGTHPDRGLELGEPAFADVITLEGDRRHVALDFQTSNSSDQFRIVTLSVPGADVPFLHNTHALPVAAPAAVTLGSLTSDTNAFLFMESAGPLSAPLSVDVSAPGTYDAPADLTPGTVPAGTPVESWMVHFNPSSGIRTVDGTITFERDILGLILSSSELTTSDALVGSSTTAYPSADPFRGVELTSTEYVRLAGDQRSIRFRLGANAIDHFRVILEE